MQKVLTFLLLFVVSGADAHVGQHEPGLIAGVLHAFSGLMPALPIFAVALLAWAKRRWG